MAKKISFGLSISEIQRVKEEFKQYQQSLNYKCELLCQRLTSHGNSVALKHIGESPLGKTITLTTNISPSQVGCRAILTAVGQDKSNDYGTINTLLLIEFGSGIYYNPIANPKADKFGMGVGTFPNQTHAFEDGWYFLSESGEWVYTHGTKATMPMYNAGKEMREQLVSIAKEVFGGR